MSLCRQHFQEECEATVNKHINLVLHSSYVYMSMAAYFDRDDVALPGLHKFFKKQSDNEREKVDKLIKYQNRRGGRVVLQSVGKPAKDDWSGPLEAVSTTLELKKKVNQALLECHAVGHKHNDAEFCDFLEGEFLKDQVELIKKVADMLSQLKRCGTGLGEFIFDEELES